jgi:hypothetical protein
VKVQAKGSFFGGTHVDNIILIGAAAFLGTFAANIVWSWWNSAPTARSPATAGESAPKRPPIVAVISAGAVLGMTVHVMNSVSSGDMAPGTGAIAIFVTAITVLLSGRALRR